MNARAKSVALVLLIAWCCVPPPVARGEKLPFKIYTTADGLAQDGINKIVRDSRGFLWFCTGDGLSRFNGYSFKTYTQEQGLPNRFVADLLETKEGEYLIATSGGLVVFDPLGKAYRWNVIDGKLEQNGSEPPMFRTFAFPADPNNKAVNRIMSLAQTDDGAVYVGTNHGLFRFIRTADGGEFQVVRSTYLPDHDEEYGGLLVDTKRGLWIATNDGIFRLTGEDQVAKISDIGGREIFQDSQQRVWIGSSGIDLGIRMFTFDGDNPRLAQTFSTKEGLRQNRFSSVVAEADGGRIFIRSKGAVGEYLPDAAPGEPKFRYFESELVETGAVDGGGNVWFGTDGKGAWKLSLNGFVSYGPEAGLSGDLISSLSLTPEGEVLLVYEDAKLNRLSNGRIESLTPVGFPGRSWGVTFLDHRSADGEWWLPSLHGLFRYPAVGFSELAHMRATKVYGLGDGLRNEVIFILFEDSRRDIWISAIGNGASLYRWDRVTGKFQSFGDPDGLKQIYGGVVSLGEDSAGDIWIGFYFGALMRFRQGRFRMFTAADGFPEGSVRDFVTDSQGRLWIATRTRGLFRVDDPSGEQPKFANFSMAQGLLSNEANCLATDKFGHIYVGTGRGLNRIDPATNSVRAYSQSDGLPGNYVSQCRTDRDGILWVAGPNSLARFVPGPEKPSVPPPIFIEGVRVNGAARRVSELGETALSRFDLGSDQRQIQIDFFALGFGSGENLRYQYRLNGRDWSAASDQRSIALDLAPGTYEFAVRAITVDGAVSPVPATVSFTIARPIWQRWWFVTLVALLLGSIVAAIVRFRVQKTRELQKAREERIAELQRVRARIATDLHDDIGSSLTQIAMHSELARQRELSNGHTGEQLDIITNVAGELVDTMSDIVWAINPSKDHLQDLTQRMRRFAANVLSAADIELEFHAPESGKDIPLGANIRREVFLIFKETINNILKHSAATDAVIKFELTDRNLSLTFQDNGQGFDPDKPQVLSGTPDWKRFRGGNGLPNMKKRAQDLGGSYEISSVKGEGTTVTLIVPFQPSGNRPQAAAGRR